MSEPAWRTEQNECPNGCGLDEFGSHQGPPDCELGPMDPSGKERPLWTRRQYLTTQVILHGASPLTAPEAVSSVAIEHPEWDMDEQKTWKEWVEQDERLKK
jgi:hypothetical protein